MLHDGPRQDDDKAQCEQSLENGIEGYGAS